jgi:amidase
MFNGAQHHPDVTDALKKTVALCESLGHTVEEATPKIDPQEATPAFLTLWSSNTALGIARLSQILGKPASLDVVEGLTLSLYEAGLKISAVEHMTAQQVFFRAGRMMAKFHETYDVWLNATLGSPPLKLGTIDIDERDIAKAFGPIINYVPFTSIQNATGQPAINLPLNWNADGLPIGVQFVARSGAEMLLLQLAAELEQAQPWIAHKPNL